MTFPEAEKLIETFFEKEWKLNPKTLRGKEKGQWAWQTPDKQTVYADLYNAYGCLHFQLVSYLVKMDNLGDLKKKKLQEYVLTRNDILLYNYFAVIRSNNNLAMCSMMNMQGFTYDILKERIIMYERYLMNEAKKIEKLLS